jgi:hypothetical protein
MTLPVLRLPILSDIGPGLTRPRAGRSDESLAATALGTGFLAPTLAS